ncbi:apoptosis-inducing factor 3 [Zeugodacus cucurbitae]|uniref:Apoptosis-inducing factor 3 n=1 Tax=Zeugodacus cucurbitae TaxID=28588 RepID=A0A0A1WXV6_ZEUCU|nr:apoptosis-inducing factor 3 [Zeugodacus cucurbitae]
MSELTNFVAVCNEADINNDEVKEYNFDENNKILLIRQNDRIWAIGATCPHQGAPLVRGVLGRGRIRCIRHGACFNIRTGDIEDFPGLDSLPSYPVEIAGNGEVRVRARVKDLNKIRRTKEMVEYDQTDERIFLLVGGGVAAATCAETLRQEGYTGRIIILCREDILPYDRTPLTKVWQVDIEDIYFRDADFYEQNNIELMLGVEAIKLDSTMRTVSCSNEQMITYDKLFIATGSKPSKLNIPCADLRNVFSLRDYRDVQAIVHALKPKTNLIFVGGGFISLEFSSIVINKVKSVLVISSNKYPLADTFGYEIGERLLQLYREKGVQMKMESRVKEIINDDGLRIIEVRTVDGYKYPCDVLVIAVGAVPNTSWLIDSTLPLNSDGTIDTDMNLMTVEPNIYVGGDIANAPILPIANQRKNIKHFQMAQYHGYIAGINMAGPIQELRAVPLFNTTLFGTYFFHGGFGSVHEISIHGDLKRLKYVAYLFDRDGNTSYVTTCSYDATVANFCELLSQGKRLHRSEVVDKSNPHQWMDKLVDTRRNRCDC